MPNKLTTEIFIERAKKKQSLKGREYDYSRVCYVNSTTKVEIVCPEHGSFWQRPNEHLRGSGCKDCVNAALNKTTEYFVEKAKNKYGNQYDYSDTIYINAKTKVKIKCNICETSFTVLPHNHLANNGGCPVCYQNRQRTSKDEYKRKANIKHKNKYEYDLSNFINGKSYIRIKCPKHGWFPQKAESHLQGHGCPECQYEHLHTINADTYEDFVKKSRTVHGYFYNYDKVIYCNSKTPVIINCPIHGDFLQTPSDHLNGCGCPQCHSSHLEQHVENILKESSLKYKSQKTFKWLKNEKTGRNLYLDFYLPNKKIAIECQGEQHFKYAPFFHHDNKSFQIQKERDAKKRILCKEHGITLLYFAHNKDYIKNVDYKVITDINELIEQIKSA